MRIITIESTVEVVRLTGSWTSIHSAALLSTNSPAMKFFVEPPVALVPFHLAEICSAFGCASALSALTHAEVWRLLGWEIERRENLYMLLSRDSTVDPQTSLSTARDPHHNYGTEFGIQKSPKNGLWYLFHLYESQRTLFWGKWTLLRWTTAPLLKTTPLTSASFR